MDIARRLYAPAAIQDRNNNVNSVDLQAVVTGLLLFDTYIVQSVWLEELILLQHSFGTAGLTQLFEAGALKFQSPGMTFGQTGQALDRPLPLFNYQFSVIRVQDAEGKVERALSAFDPALRSQMIKARVYEPPDYAKSVFEVFYKDLAAVLLNSALKIELRRKGIIPISHSLRVEQTAPDEFRVDNDLTRKYLLPALDAHRMIESAMMAVGRMDERLASMHAHSALTGITENDRQLLDAKFESLAGLVDSAPTSREQTFSRVVSLTGLPVPQYGSTVIDVKKLLSLRESDECRAFKDWLAGAETLSDKELRERVSGFGKRIRQAMNTNVGKAVRFVVSNGLGFISGPVGLVAGMLDSFLLEKLMPKDSVVNFLSESYPSLFKRG